MGLVIFIGLVALAILALLSPTLQRRALRRREDVERAAEDAVIRRLEDHPRRRRGKDDPDPPR